MPNIHHVHPKFSIITVTYKLTEKPSQPIQKISWQVNTSKYTTK